MAAFNYKQLIRQIQCAVWQQYFESRKITFPSTLDWSQPIEKLCPDLLKIIDECGEQEGNIIQNELRRVHILANRQGVDALRNSAPLASPLHEEFPQLSGNAERVIWAMMRYPELFDEAEVIFNVDRCAGKSGWKRLTIQPVDQLYLADADINGLAATLATAFTPPKSKPRVCEIDVLTRHLDGGVQLSIRIEDNQQRNLEFGENDHTHWRTVRPPRHAHAVIYGAAGVIDLLIQGGQPSRNKLMTSLGKHIFKKELQPEAIKQPVFFLNRLRDGLELFDESDVDVSAYQIDHMRISELKIRGTVSPECDITIKPPAGKEFKDALACLDKHLVKHDGFQIIDAVVSVYFLPAKLGKTGRVLHIQIKRIGISNLRDLDENDATLAESLLRAWGVMQGESSQSTLKTEPTIS